MTVKVSIVDDDRAVLFALKVALDAAKEVTCVGCHSSGIEALEMLPKTHPNVVVMDIRMPGMSGIDCTRKLKTIVPGVRVIMLTALDDRGSLLRSLMAGASGYLVKPVSAKDFVSAIKEVSTGGAPLSKTVAAMLIESFHSMNWEEEKTAVSQREQEILSCLFEGLRDKQIAAKLGMAMPTVRTHLRRMFRKFNVASRAQLLEKFMSVWPAEKPN
jgi:DNA-binding NarL/FixJ family response regulator